MEHWEVATRLGVADTIAAYAHAADRGDSDEFAACFATDGVLEIVDEGEHRGRDAIRAFVRRVAEDLAGATGPRIFHHVTTARVTVEGPESARARSYFLALTDAGIDHWGRYADHLAPVDGRWRFARRRVRTDGAVPGGFAATRLGPH